MKPHLFKSLKIRDVTLRNRIGVSPMCQYISKNGHIDLNWTLQHLGSRAAGGAGLIFTEAVAVSPEGRITPGCAGIWDDQYIANWTQVVDFCKSMGAVIGIAFLGFVLFLME